MRLRMSPPRMTRMNRRRTSPRHASLRHTNLPDTSLRHTNLRHTSLPDTNLPLISLRRSNCLRRNRFRIRRRRPRRSCRATRRCRGRSRATTRSRTTRRRNGSPTRCPAARIGSCQVGTCPRRDMPRLPTRCPRTPRRPIPMRPSIPMRLSIVMRPIHCPATVRSRRRRSAPDAPGAGEGTSPTRKQPKYVRCATPAEPSRCQIVDRPTVMRGIADREPAERPGAARRRPSKSGPRPRPGPRRPTGSYRNRRRRRRRCRTPRREPMRPAEPRARSRVPSRHEDHRAAARPMVVCPPGRHEDVTHRPRRTTISRPNPVAFRPRRGRWQARISSSFPARRWRATCCGTVSSEPNARMPSEQAGARAVEASADARNAKRTGRSMSSIWTIWTAAPMCTRRSGLAPPRSTTTRTTSTSIPIRSGLARGSCRRAVPGSRVRRNTTPIGGSG
ncbi:pentapeptide repeat-containing protein [Nocardia sp. GCM10030253]|uniref:pentapeptide repeat-containing protein n=1 Tax=Nocardia sp. GCM10030253 TaxID=3273404 RepID=UPI00362BD0DF